jgi:hypothetical protein
LSNQAIQVFIVGSLNVEVTAANVIDSLIINHEAAVRVFQGGVGSQDGVVWFNNRGGNLGSWVDAELKLALFAIVNRETFHQESTESRAGTTAKRVKDQETLETRAIVGNTANLVQDIINQLLANGVMTASIVVGSVLLAGNHLFRMEQVLVEASADFIDDIWLEIAVNGTWNIFSLA